MKILAGKHAIWGDPLGLRDWLNVSKQYRECSRCLRASVFLLEDIKRAMDIMIVFYTVCKYLCCMVVRYHGLNR